MPLVIIYQGYLFVGGTHQFYNYSVQVALDNTTQIIMNISDYTLQHTIGCAEGGKKDTNNILVHLVKLFP